MGSVVDFSKKIYKTVLDPFGHASDGGYSGLDLTPDVKTPKIGKAPELDPAEARTAAEAAAERRKRRSIGAFGVTDTYKTGPQGLATGDTIKGTKTLLGG